MKNRFNKSIFFVIINLGSDHMKLNLKNKKLVIIGIALIIVIIISLCVFLSIKNKTRNTLNSYNNTMKELGKIFYEDLFYNVMYTSNGKDYFEIYKDTGLEVDLNTLEMTNAKSRELAKKLVNISTKESCDKTKTKVIITTKDPYEKTDYNIEVKLDCGFNN